ncbi:MAG: type II toxin-antitoxin system VapC family toxin [Terracidiphilus sp.]|jgi:predicted nucleic acid-binding protein
MFLLDTNVLSELRRQKPHGAVLAWLQGIHASELRIPAVTIAELQDGAELTRRQNPVKAVQLDRWIERIMNTFAVIPMDGVHFREWSRLMVGKSGDLAADAMVAATARIHRMTVVTRNVKDFKVFKVDLFNPFTYRIGKTS